MKCYFKKVVKKARQNANRIFAFIFKVCSGVFTILAGAYLVLMIKFGVDAITLIGFIVSVILAVINSSESLEKYKKHFYETCYKEQNDPEMSLGNDTSADNSNVMAIEFQLNRQWILNETDDEIIGEKNFVVSAEYFATIFNKLFPEEQNVEIFLDVYEPEYDGEKIYQQALLDNQIITEFDTIYKDGEDPFKISTESVKG